MAQNTISLWNFYKGWDVYQGHLVRAIEPLTAEQLELKLSPDLRSIGQIARHIIRTRAGWLNGLMGEGGPNVA
ncbi:MAG: damage-inducible protein DinB, partial [Chloroflexi bacterium]